MQAAPCAVCHPDSHSRCDMYHPGSSAGPFFSAYAPASSAHTPRRTSFEVPLCPPFFDYVVDRLADVVATALDPSWSCEPHAHPVRHPFLRPFVEAVITKSRCRTSTVLVALAYLDRARPRLRISAGMWACERALIGALALANKYTNDEIYSTKAWAIASGLFTVRDVVRAERELIQVLHFDLHVREAELAAHYEAIAMRCRYPAVSPQTFVSRPAKPVLPPLQYPAYTPLQTPSVHALRRSSACSIMSSGSASPLDSPELQTPESYPYNVPAHAASDAKRSNPSASYAIPYVLADDLPAAYPEFSFSASQRSLAPTLDGSAFYLFADGKDFGDVAPDAQPSLLAELLEDLDPKYMTLPRPSEVVPPTQSHSHFPPAGAPQWPDVSHQYAVPAEPISHPSWSQPQPVYNLPYVY